MIPRSILPPLVPALLAIACSAGRNDTSAASCKVVPGTPVQVSNEVERSGDRPAYMFELQLAMNPTKEDNLVMSGIHVRGPAKDDPDKRSQVVLAYHSEDRGKTWQKTDIPPFPKEKGQLPFAGDPSTVFTKKGTAIYMHYGVKNRNFAHLSSDGGRSWGPGSQMVDDGVDHWMVAGDYTDGAYAGNVYAWGMGTKMLKKDMRMDSIDYNLIEYQQLLLRSQDEGKTWTQHMATTTTELGLTGHGLNSVSDLLIAPNGKLYLPFHSWNNIDRKKPRGQWMTVSEDAGATFAKPWETAKADGSLLTGPMAGGYPGYALDVTTGPYKNRLYIVWYDSTAAGRWQLLFSHSDDEGKTFADPRVLADSLVKMDQSHPDLQVNKDGVLLFIYYRFGLEGPVTETKGGKEQELVYNRYVTASLDGGKTFLPTQQLTPTMSRSAGRTSEYGVGFKHVRFGDYFNILADREGRFHTVWMGGAAGPTQAWYNSIGVECDGRPAMAR